MKSQHLSGIPETNVRLFTPEQDTVGHAAGQRRGSLHLTYYIKKRQRQREETTKPGVKVEAEAWGGRAPRPTGVTLGRRNSGQRV